MGANRLNYGRGPAAASAGVSVSETSRLNYSRGHESIADIRRVGEDTETEILELKSENRRLKSKNDELRAELSARLKEESMTRYGIVRLTVLCLCLGPSVFVSAFVFVSGGDSQAARPIR